MDENAFGGFLQDGVHSLFLRVYYADTDFSGLVYHGRYLEFLEKGRTEFLRLHHIEHSALAQKGASMVAREAKKGANTGTEKASLAPIKHSQQEKILPPEDRQKSSNTQEKLIWVVRHLDIDFIRPAHMDDILHVKTFIEGNSGARLYMGQALYRCAEPLKTSAHRVETSEELMVKARVEVVLINEAGRVQRFPKGWMEKFTVAPLNI